MLAWWASLHQVVFMPGWSAFAESAEAAVGVEALGLVWPGTEPKASQGFLAAPYRYYRSLRVKGYNQPLIMVG